MGNIASFKEKETPFPRKGAFEKNKRGWKTSLAQLLKEKSRYSTDGNKVVSFATIQARREALFKVFKDLRDELGFKILDVKNLKGKHIHKLIKLYANLFQQGQLSAATIRNRISHLRTFSKWINKPGLVKPLEYYIDLPIKRSSTANMPKTWSARGINPLIKIEAIKQDTSFKNESVRIRVADALLLQFLFGLRSKESLLLKPHMADKGEVLVIDLGSKGGRSRFIPIETLEQRELLDKIKSYIGLNESMIPKDKSYDNFRRQYYNILKKHGITRADGITAHGLRHQHLNDLYERTTGVKTPVHGGNLYQNDKELDKFGRALVSERAGHNRIDIAGAYIGGTRKKSQ